MSHETTSIDQPLDSRQDHDQPLDSRQDLVFNDETCRALRRDGRDVGRVLAVFGAFAIIFPLGYALPALAWSPLSNFALAVAGSTVTAVATVGVMWWVNLMPTRERVHDLKHEIVRFSVQQYNLEHRLPPESEYRPPEQSDEPSLRPALAFGLPPEDCCMVFAAPLLLLFGAVMMVEGTTAILSVGACLALSGVLFAFAKHEQPHTYPPEDPPTDRDAGGD
jgi:hypothetical protein